MNTRFARVVVLVVGALPIIAHAQAVSDMDDLISVTVYGFHALMFDLGLIAGQQR